LEWNPAAERVFGYSRDHAVGTPVAEHVIPPRMRAAHWAGLARYLETGEGIVIGQRLELTGVRANGEEFPVEGELVLGNDRHALRNDRVRVLFGGLPHQRPLLTDVGAFWPRVDGDLLTCPTADVPRLRAGGFSQRAPAPPFDG
jgi:hypothetical protein